MGSLKRKMVCLLMVGAPFGAIKAKKTSSETSNKSLQEADGTPTGAEAKIASRTRAQDTEAQPSLSPLIQLFERCKRKTYNNTISIKWVVEEIQKRRKPLYPSFVQQVQELSTLDEGMASFLLVLAMVFGEDALVEKIASSEKVNWFDDASIGFPVTHYAVWLGRLPYLQVCVQNGAEINTDDFKGRTLLMLAAALNDKEIVNWFLKQESIQIDAVDYIGKTAWHYACEHNHLGVAELLPSGSPVQQEASDQEEEEEQSEYLEKKDEYSEDSEEVSDYIPVNGEYSDEDEEYNTQKQQSKKDKSNGKENSEDSEEIFDHGPVSKEYSDEDEKYNTQKQQSEKDKSNGKDYSDEGEEDDQASQLPSWLTQSTNISPRSQFSIRHPSRDSSEDKRCDEMIRKSSKLSQFGQKRRPQQPSEVEESQSKTSVERPKQAEPKDEVTKSQ
ncbi:MAG: ankyrin repeat domain-containing protein [Puniceicoccales bacterium]|jgi:hypothetical protein|nr:ankyrin repeat domain-containing protein [Puniceicoccales bacterium]